MGTVSIWPLLGLVTFALVVAIVARWGWRWRREAIAPRCRRCGYDVSQRPTGVERCSECGADLTSARALRTERRVANRWLAVPATLAAVVAVTLAAYVGVRFPFGDWFRETAPIGWIHALARRDLRPEGDEYRAAWRRRDDGPAYLDHLLDIGADDAIAWRTALGDELILALDANRMTAEQRERFARQLFTTPTFRVRTPVRAGDPLPIVADFTPKAGAKQWTQSRRWLEAAVEGGAELRGESAWGIGSAWGDGLGHDSRTISAEDWGSIGIAPGRHKVKVRLKRELIAVPRGRGPDDAKSLSTPTVAGATLDLDVLPAGTPLGRAVPAPELADAVAESIEVGAYKLADHQWVILFRLKRAAMDRAFTVYARIDGVEKRIGSTALMAGKTYWTSGETFGVIPDDGRLPEAVTIRFVGDGDALARTFDQHEYWPGTITFADVPLGTLDEMMNVLNRRVTATTRPYVVEPATPR